MILLFLLCISSQSLVGTSTQPTVFKTDPSTFLTFTPSLSTVPLSTNKITRKCPRLGAILGPFVSFTLTCHQILCKISFDSVPFAASHCHHPSLMQIDLGGLGRYWGSGCFRVSLGHSETHQCWKALYWANPRGLPSPTSSSARTVVVA